MIFNHKMSSYYIVLKPLAFICSSSHCSVTGMLEKAQDDLSKAGTGGGSSSARRNMVTIVDDEPQQRSSGGGCCS